MAARAMRPAATWLVLALLLVPAAPAVASGIDLHRAKSMGVVGERADGYVGVVVPQAGAAFEAVVKRTNNKRREAYEAVSKKVGTTVTVVEIVAGEKLIGRASKGDWVTDTSGVWHRK